MLGTKASKNRATNDALIAISVGMERNLIRRQYRIGCCIRIHNSALQMYSEDMNITSLLADTEFPENLVENIFDIDPAEQAAQRLRRRPEFFGDQLVALPRDRQGAL